MQNQQITHWTPYVRRQAVSGGNIFLAGRSLSLPHGTSVPAIAPLCVRSRHFQSYFNLVSPLGQAQSRHSCEVSQTLRSKWRDCVEGSGAIVLWEGRDCVAGSGTPVPPATAITTTPIMYATKKVIYVFTTFYIYLILRCSTVGRWRSLVLSLLVSPTYAPRWYLPRALHVGISHVRSVLISPTYAPCWYLLCTLHFGISHLW